MPRRRTLLIAVALAAVVALVFGGGLLSTMVVRGIAIGGGFDKQLYRPGETATLSFTLNQGRAAYWVTAWAVDVHGQAATPSVRYEDARQVSNPFMGPGVGSEFSWSVTTGALPLGSGIEGPIRATVCITLHDSLTGKHIDPATVGTPCPLEDLKFSMVYATESAAIVSSLVGTLVATLECTADGLTASCAAKVVGGTEPYRFSWYWGEGTPEVAGASASHAYAAAGTYRVTLSVTDSSGQASNDASSVSVSDTPPIVDDPPPVPCVGAGCDVSDVGIPLWLWLVIGIVAIVAFLAVVRRRLF